MSPISSSPALSTLPPSSTTNTVAGAAELQKQQRQDIRETVKPVAEQVFISKQAQQQLETYAASAANAADRYDTEASSSTAGVNTEQVLETVTTVQNRQTAAALAQYAQQQAQANPPKPEPRSEVEQKPTTSIKAIA